MVFLFICLTIILILIFSKIRIQIENFRFSSVNKRHINKDYKAIIKVYILKKIPILKINITKTKLERLKIKEKIRKINFKLIGANATSMPAILFYFITITGMILMSIFAFKLDSTKAKSNWTEQITNAVAQLALLFGVIFTF